MASRGAGVYNLTRFTEKILKRTRKDTPSLLMHLYTDYFRLGDHNDVRYSYDGDLKGWIPFIREQRMPNELLDVLDEAGVKFFDGCLIVEVYDHRSGEKGKGDIKTPPGPPNGAAATAAVPAAPAEQPDMYRILLSPTGETLWRDLQLMNETKAAQWAATANAKKRDHKWKPMTEEEAVEVEAAIIERTSPALCLAPTLITSRIANQMLSETTLFNPREQRKMRKRSLPDPGEEEAQRRKRERKERLMHVGDESYGSGFAPSFGRFDKIAAIRKGREEHHLAEAQRERAEAATSGRAADGPSQAGDASGDSIPVHPPSQAPTPAPGGVNLARKVSGSAAAAAAAAAAKKRLSIAEAPGATPDASGSGAGSPLNPSSQSKSKVPLAGAGAKPKPNETAEEAAEKKRKRAEAKQKAKEKKEAAAKAAAAIAARQSQQPLPPPPGGGQYPSAGIPVPQPQNSIPVPQSAYGQGSSPAGLLGSNPDTGFGFPDAGGMFSNPGFGAGGAGGGGGYGQVSPQQQQQGIPVPSDQGIPVPQHLGSDLAVGVGLPANVGQAWPMGGINFFGGNANNSLGGW